MHKLFKFALGSALLVAFLFPNSTFAATSSASGISIRKITIGEERIETGRKQLIEVLIKNAIGKDVEANVKLSLVLPNHNIITFGNRSVNLKAKSDTRVLIPYPIQRNKGGDYTVGAKIYSKKGRVLAKNTARQQQLFFAVDPSRKHQKPSRKSSLEQQEARKKEEIKKKEEMEAAKPLVMFDPPDLVIRDLSILHNDSILRGETAHARITVVNEGGDIAINSKLNVYWYFAPRPNRKIEALTDVIKIIAPGEKKIIEVPVTIPAVEQKGQYMVYAILDEPNLIPELDDNNNHFTSKKPLIFNDIALVFPDDSHAFAEDGLFKFEWRSKKFNRFKVQISADKLFSDLEEIFELPKGGNSEGWTPADFIKPLSGEMPAMALALMESNGIDYLYWRVRAKDSEGGTTESSIRKFHINLKAAIQ